MSLNYSINGRVGSSTPTMISTARKNGVKALAALQLVFANVTFLLILLCRLLEQLLQFTDLTREVMKRFFDLPGIMCLSSFLGQLITNRECLSYF